MTNTTKKITKRERFEQIKAIVADNADLVAFVEHEIELLNKKNSVGGEKKLTAKQNENLAYAEMIVNGMERGRNYTTTEVIKEMNLVDAEGNALATQRVAPILNKLVEDGKLVKTIEKRKTLFSLA